MYRQLYPNYYWRGMKEECLAFVLACKHCGERKSQAVIGAPAATAPTPDHPFQVVHVDHKSGLPLSRGYTSVLVAVCALTRFTLYIPVRDLSGPTTLRALIDEVFSVFGIPLVIISDNGSSFANKLMTASEKLYGYRWIYVMPHTPQANGMAEAAVKKLKIMLDRNTSDYLDWAPLIKPFQAAINQFRESSGTREAPFRALFGRAATPLAALENPELLPGASPPELEVRDFAVRMSDLHSRIKRASDDLKEAKLAASAPDKASRIVRRVAVGDRVWLLYSDGERARYLRKHGHGRPWRHPYLVLRVKPHAVQLEVPQDGSVPEVLEWQSLRKCSFAPPAFHSDSLPVPEITDQGLPTIEPRRVPTAGEVPPTSTPDDPNGWGSWERDPSAQYEIEKIVGAEKKGGGWRLSVKWKGYPEPTPEPLARILRHTRHADILADIERCKRDYLAKNPTAVPDDVSPDVPAQGATNAYRRRSPRFADVGMVVTPGLHNSPISTMYALTALRRLRDQSKRRACALEALIEDPISPARYRMQAVWR